MIKDKNANARFTRTVSRISVPVAVFVLLFIRQNAAALEGNLMVGTGNWIDASRWSKGVPTANHQARISSKRGTGPYRTAIINAGDACVAGEVCVSQGTDSRGVIDHRGGTLNVVGTLYVGRIYGRGWYHLSGGQLLADTEIVRNYGNRYDVFFGHTAGLNTCRTLNLIEHGRYRLVGAGQLEVSENLTVEPGCKFEIAGPGRIAVIQNAALDGAFTCSGGGTDICFGSFSESSAGLLEGTVDETGISTIEVSGAADLGGAWKVLDDGAAFGRFDILTAQDGISGGFDSITLPGAEWSWGIEDGKTLWVEHIPEPATLSLLAFGAAVILKRRKRSVWHENAG